jgi:hypothetical protein
VKRPLAFLLLAAALTFGALPAPAQELTGANNVGSGSYLKWSPLYMRNTTAAALIARNPNWAVGIPGNPGSVAYTDSVVFRRGATTATVYDTSAAYPISSWPFPPNFGTTLSNALVDTSSVPWIVVRVRQDSTTFGSSTTPTSSLDSVRVAVEYSYDGISWNSCAGTPTYRFDVVFLTSGQDGVQNPTLIGVEAATAVEDAAAVILKCHPSQAGASGTVIVNRTLCMQGGFARFIIGGDYTGQYAVEVASWQNH